MIHLVLLVLEFLIDKGLPILLQFPCERVFRAIRVVEESPIRSLVSTSQAICCLNSGLVGLLTDICRSDQLLLILHAIIKLGEKLLHRLALDLLARGLRTQSVVSIAMLRIDTGCEEVLLGG